MSVFIKSRYSRLRLNTDAILKEIDFEELLRRREAGGYATKVMRKNVSEKGFSTPGGYPARRTGATKRKVGMQLLKSDRSVKVGSKDFKAHLLEFGHGDGKTRNKRPFVFPSLREAEPEVIRIFSRKYF